jgi:nitrate/TMAO reductase-like tetraheme cytochrome c subunit
MQIVTLVKVAGVTFAVLGVLLSGLLIFLQAQLKRGETKMWTFWASAVVFIKWVAFGGLFAAPAVTIAMANYHLFEGTKDVESCARCHVMEPKVRDMADPHSLSLAARHYRNGWIAKQQCFTCHTDYGLYGTVKAKMDGFRHLVKYVTGTYEEPIRYPYRYNNQNCLACHKGTPLFERVQSHHTIRDRLESSTVSCTNCHGAPHR